MNAFYKRCSFCLFFAWIVFMLNAPQKVLCSTSLLKEAETSCDTQVLCTECFLRNLCIKSPLFELFIRNYLLFFFPVQLILLPANVLTKTWTVDAMWENSMFSHSIRAFYWVLICFKLTKKREINVAYYVLSRFNGKWCKMIMNKIAQSTLKAKKKIAIGNGHPNS